MTNTTTLLFSLLFVIGITNLLNAQVIDTSLVQDIDEVVVSATRSASKIQDLPINIDVVSKRLIQESNPISPVEALQYIPGITRQSDGGLATTPIIRGLARERAPILIDGNPFVGGRIRSYSLIDPFQIERMEVVKGPASAFWGSDAVSGLVNVVTRKAENGFGKEMKIGGSLYGGYQSVAGFSRGRIEVEGRGNGLDFLIGGGMRNAGNTNTPEGEIANSQFESTNLDFNIGYSWAANQRIEVSGKYYENKNVGFPGGLGAPGPPRIDRRFAPDKQTALNIAYDATNLSGPFESIGARIFMKKQSLHIDQTTNIFFPMTMNPNRIIDVELDVDVPFMGGKIWGTMRQNDNAKLTFGLDYLREHRIGTHRDLNIKIFNPMGTMVNEINRPFTQIQPDSYSNSIGIFAIEEMKLNNKLDLLIAARFDNVSTRIEDGPFDIPAIASIYDDTNTSDSDVALTGSLGLQYRPSKSFSLMANVANSFRGTDLFSKYHFTAVGAGFLVPNPDLDPERGVFYELGTKFNSGNFSAEANFFQNHLSNLFVPVDLEFNGSPSIQFRNVGEATITGLEWNTRLKFGTLSHAFFSGAFIKGDNDVTGGSLPQIPATQMWLGVNYRDANNKFYIQPEMMLVSEQSNIAPNEVLTPGYGILNIKAGFNLGNISSTLPNAQLTLSITNLTDKAYRSHVSRGAPGNQNVFLEAGRSINLGFVIRLGDHVN